MTWRAKKYDLATKQGEVIFDEPTFFFSGTHAPPLSPLFGAVCGLQLFKGFILDYIMTTLYNEAT